MRGLEGVSAQLREVSAEMGARALSGAARAAFKRVVETAKQLVPVDSGELRESLTVRVVKPKSGDAVVVVGVAINNNAPRLKMSRIAAAAFNEAQSTNLPPGRRWHFIELGTVKQAAHPFLRPALDQNAQSVVDDLKVQLRKKIEAAVKKASKGTSK